MKFIKRILIVPSLVMTLVYAHGDESALVFQTDFGLRDDAVAAMKGVAFGISPTLKQFDLTHEIQPYNVWQAAYRLQQAAPYWPTGTVFVSVVDPGVGTERRAVVLKSKSGHYFVTPDNGTLTFVADSLGIEELREIDVARHRRPGSEASHTFHGRDVFALTGAELASGKMQLVEVGRKLPAAIVSIPHQRAELDAGVLKGCLPVLDERYGNVWSNIEKPLFDQLQPRFGDEFAVRVFRKRRLVYSGRLPFMASFGSVEKGKPLLYLNSLLAVSLALNQGDFARQHGIQAGPEWSVEIRKLSRRKR